MAPWREFRDRACPLSDRRRTALRRRGSLHVGHDALPLARRRTAKRWKRDTGTDAPIQLHWVSYDYDTAKDANRTAYVMPDALADEILSF